MISFQEGLQIRNGKRDDIYGSKQFQLALGSVMG